MEKARVYFTDFRTPYGGDTMPGKLKKLIRKAGIAQLNLEGQFVAIKIHFGEPGNLAYLRPNYAKTVADLVQGARRQALPDGLQHALCRRPQERARPHRYRLCQRLHALYDGLPHHHRRRPEGHGRGRRARSRAASM